MRVGANGGRSKNYEPNSFDGPVQTNDPHYGGLPVAGVSGTYEWDRRETDDFEQAGALYRLIDAAAKQRLVDNIAGGLAQVNRREIVDRSVSHFRNADPEYGDRIERAIDALHS
jgi:catalase